MKLKDIENTIKKYRDKPIEEPLTLGEQLLIMCVYFYCLKNGH